MLDPWRVHACLTNPALQSTMPFYGAETLYVWVPAGPGRPGEYVWTYQTAAGPLSRVSRGTWFDVVGSPWNILRTVATAVATVAEWASWNAPPPSLNRSAALEAFARMLRPVHHLAPPPAGSEFATVPRWPTSRQPRGGFQDRWWRRWYPLTARADGPLGMQGRGFVWPESDPAPQTVLANEQGMGSMAHNADGVQPFDDERLTLPQICARLNMAGHLPGYEWTPRSLLASAYADAVANGAPPGGWPAPGL